MSALTLLFFLKLVLTFLDPLYPLCFRCILSVCAFPPIKTFLVFFFHWWFDFDLGFLNLEIIGIFISLSLLIYEYHISLRLFRFPFSQYCFIVFCIDRLVFIVVCIINLVPFYFQFFSMFIFNVCAMYIM